MAKEIIEAPMTGKIISISLKVGDVVNVDDEICILEAMKMENPICASITGKIVELCVTPNQQVNVGYKIAVIEG
ncbi:MAG: acetyl-CoA carboxylase biotin carboxyl carrier protein subunit [Chloroflexi bacterium]|nr:acetyl-CoA carboxylase biotin carboxyl carrier protein subunit [Chloroflexota bacterium]